jgi:hypothetical protein
MAVQETVKGQAGPAKGAAALPCEALSQARQQLLGLLVAQAQAGTVLMGQLVVLPLRTACAVWTQFASFPSWSGTVESLEQTAKEPPQKAQPAADETERADGPETDESRRVQDEGGAAIAALTEPLPMDQVSTEQPSTEQPSTEQPPSEQPSTEQPFTAAGATTNGRVDVGFRLPAAVNAHSAHVCGEFNGWSTTADPMDRLDDGSFELTRALRVGRRWHFRYLLDGDRWENDWAADDYTSNAFGDHDSVVDLQTPSTSRLVLRNRFPGAGGRAG